MPLIIQSAKETDLEEAGEVDHSAFAKTSAVHGIMFPNGNTDYVKSWLLKSFKETFHDPRATCYKVVDTENNNRMAAWIDWKTYETDQPESEWVPPKFKTSEAAKEETHPDVNSAFTGMFFSSFDMFKRDYIKGKARLHIRLLVTHPDYFRRGCGKMLLDECAKHADKLALPITLEASPFAVKLYLREGFELVPGAVAKIDLKPYGLDSVNEAVLMRKPVIGGGTGGI